MASIRRAHPSTPFQINAVFIEESDFVSASKIRKETGFDLSLIHAHVKLLKKYGLVENRQSARGVHSWRITDEGKRVFADLREGFNIVRELGGL